MREEMQQGAKDTKISMKARGAKKLASSSMHDERMPELQERAPSKHNTASESVRGNKRTCEREGSEKMSGSERWASLEKISRKQWRREEEARPGLAPVPAYSLGHIHVSVRPAPMTAIRGCILERSGMAGYGSGSPSTTSSSPAVSAPAVFCRAASVTLSSAVRVSCVRASLACCAPG